MVALVLVKGFEPSKNVADFSKKYGLKIINNFFSYKNVKNLKNFKSNTDVICAANVISHIPNLKDLIKGIDYLLSKKGVFVSTPNRWHPLSGWLRPQPHAGLVDAMKIKTMVDVLPGHPPWRLGHVRVMGLKSHYFLMIWKDERYVPAPVADQTAVVEPPTGRNPPGNETKEVVQGFP